MQSDDLGLVERLKKAAKPIKVFAGVSSRGAVYRTDKPLHAALLTEAAKALAAKDAAIERLVAERDEAREAWQKAETASLLSDEAIQYASVTLGGPDEWSDQETMIFSIRATAEAAEAQRDKLKEALKPFADAAARYDPDEGDDLQLAWNSKFTLFSLRRARQALGDT